MQCVFIVLCITVKIIVFSLPYHSHNLTVPVNVTLLGDAYVNTGTSWSHMYVYNIKDLRHIPVIGLIMTQTQACVINRTRGRCYYGQGAGL